MLDRRLLYFEIYKNDADVSIEELTNIVWKKLKGSGQNFDYRRLHQKLRIEHKMFVPRDLVYAVMSDLDKGGLEARRPLNKKKKKCLFTSICPHFVFSLDGHDKPFGYQNWAFPICIYGCSDTATIKLMFVKVWTSNSDPVLPAKWYLITYIVH